MIQNGGSTKNLFPASFCFFVHLSSAGCAAKFHQLWSSIFCLVSLPNQPPALPCWWAKQRMTRAVASVTNCLPHSQCHSAYGKTELSKSSEKCHEEMMTYSNSTIAKLCGRFCRRLFTQVVPWDKVVRWTSSFADFSNSDFNVPMHEPETA